MIPTVRKIFCRFFVGPCEEQGYEKPELPIQENSVQEDNTGFLRLPYKLLSYIKGLSSHQSCLHQHSCLYYGLHVSTLLKIYFIYLFIIIRNIQYIS